MGLTKQYRRFRQSALFGVIGSQNSNIVFLDIKGTRDKYCAVGACEEVFIWDLRTGEKHLTLHGEKHEVTVISRSPDRRHMAVGYNDGTVRIFDLTSGECTITFSGHKSTVTALHYDHQGLRLVSGSKDTDVIVWDIVNESGLYRLKGHKGQVTQACFLKERDVLVTSSKDTFIKFWDLDTQHCFKTLVGHRSEIYDFVLLRNGHRLITGSGDSELRIWDITYTDKVNDLEVQPPSKKARVDALDEGDSDGEEDLDILTCTKMGSVMRKSNDRLVSMVTDAAERLLVCHGPDSNLEIFHLLSNDELMKRLAKRRKKARLKNKGVAGEEDTPIEVVLEDEVKKLNFVKMPAKIKSFDIFQDSGDTVIVALLNNNSVKVCKLDCFVKTVPPTPINHLILPGHRTDVRTVCFSSDNTAILSAAGESAKVWNRDSLQCIRTMACDYALCSVFAPGDRHIIIGTKSGKLQVFDVASGTLLESFDAHTGAVWSICLSPDKRGFVSGSADHEVRFWNFELITDKSHSLTSKRLTIEHVRTLKMDEDVLCVKYSPDHRLLAVSLLDNTVKVFFADTLKFFLSLYGHKLPVLCMDISTDSTLLITGSADRNVKIWGLDFGDCHKSIFAHDDSIMCLQFVPKTHQFFTGGKDKKIKHWDGDKFEHITTLEGHHAAIWCLAVSFSGNFVVSGSHDKSLRLWEKTQEPLVLEDEREMEREKEYEESVAQSGETVVPGETTTEVSLAGKKTVETVKAAERLMEALEVYKEETFKQQIHRAECEKTQKKLPPPRPNPLMVAYKATSPDRYLLEVIKKIKSSELEESLLVLPFSCVTDLMKVLDIFLQSGWETELVCRCLFFLLRVHHGQITSNRSLLPVIDRLRSNTVSQVTEIRDQIGFNMAGLNFLQRQIEEAEEIRFFADATDHARKKKKRLKRKAVLQIKT